MDSAASFGRDDSFNQAVLVVVPAYRETKRLPLFLEPLARELSGAGPTYEILVVDDGSPSIEQKETAELVEALQKPWPCLLPPLLLPHNRGKGAAVRAGWDSAKGFHWLAFVDADGSVSATTARKFFEHAIKGGDECAYFGARVKMLGKKVERRTTRHLSGRFFASLVGKWITPQVYDSQCGLKILPARFYEMIAPSLEEDGFCFDVELLAALLAKKLAVKEIPIDWSDIAGSKVSLLRDSIRMIAALRRIRARQSKKS